MYKPESFLKHANEFLAAEVSEETLTEVRDVSFENKKRANPSLNPPRSDIERAVLNWLLKHHKKVTQYPNNFPDFITSEEDILHGYDIKQIRSTRFNIYEDIILHAKNAITKRDLSTLTIIFIVDTSFTTRLILSTLLSHKIPDIPDNIIIAFGQVNYSAGGPVFEVVYEERYNDIINNTAV